MDIGPATDWFRSQGWNPFPFQEDTWRACLAGHSGLLNAPTGSGKTYALLLPILLEGIGQPRPGLRAIWITPIRALTRDIQQAAQRATQGLGLDWTIAVRTGDTDSAERARQKKNPPQILITTPESLHLLLATKGYPQLLKDLRYVVADEWHELLGSKRGVQVELALSRLRALLPALRVWGISATIGNLTEARDVLLGPGGPGLTLRADIHRPIEVRTILPQEIERFPWAGHLGLRLLPDILPVIHASRSTLIFTNTRAQSEIWYQQLLEADPSLAGVMALHHGSLSREVRDWVEEGLHTGQLKAVVCTSSLDLGVDFRPVETVVQVGSPKGIARFLQRAGRSGHQPGGVSRIWFVPTHSLELLEASALRDAARVGEIEARLPYVRSFDVLIQYLVTLSLSEGFRPAQVLEEVRTTYSFASISEAEWRWVLDFIVTGGPPLAAYDEYRKVVREEDGLYRVASKRIALRHRLSIGTIASDTSLVVKYLGGPRIGTIEEWFISQLQPGDVFWFSGKSLELVRIKDMEVLVRKSNQKTGKAPSWLGGRLSFSAELGHFLQEKIYTLAAGNYSDAESEKLRPLLEWQADRSHLPGRGEFLIEYFRTREGFHLVFYPFEGRQVHEVMGALVAYRLSRLRPLTFSIAMNDYGVELLSEQPIPIEEALEAGLFGLKDLSADIQSGVNATEMARRRFRDIAGIAGLIFKGYPGAPKKDRHLQASSQLFFEVYSEYEPDNLLLLQAYEEVHIFGWQEARLRGALERIQNQRLILTRPEKPTPFAFPILVDRLRERLSSEKLEDRIRRMLA